MAPKITITYQPTDDEWKKLIEDLWVTVLEGGSNYWIDHVDYGQEFKIKDGNDLIKNFHIIIRHGGDWDANDADHIMQLGTFGEVVYG